eukprot:PhM_4_TR7273/c0_g1_i1/m.90757
MTSSKSTSSSSSSSASSSTANASKTTTAASANLPSTVTMPGREMPREDNMGKKSVDPHTRSAMEYAIRVGLSFAKFTHATPGFFLSVVNKGDSVTSSCGYRDGARGLDLEDKGNYLRLKDPLSLSNVTQVVTSYLAMLLHDEKKLDLDAPITKYAAGLAATSDCTLRTLLSNRSGIRDWRVLHSYGCGSSARFLKRSCDAHPIVMKTVQERTPNSEALLQFFADNKIAMREMGKTKLRPSVFGVAVAAAIIEHATSRPIGALMKDKIFDPAGAETVDFGEPTPKEQRNAHLFYQTKGSAKPHWRINVVADTISMPLASVLQPALGLYGTSDDISTILHKAWNKIADEAFATAPPEGITWFHAESFMGTVVLRGQHSVVNYAPLAPTIPYPHMASAVYNRDYDIGAFCSTNCANLRSAGLTRLSTKGGIKVFNEFLNAALKAEKAGRDLEEEQSPLNPKDKGMLLNFIGRKTSPHRF